MRALGHRLRQTFGISAPRMAVRTHLSWRWRLLALFAVAAIVGGMWWWGFDFGQLLSGFNRSEVAEKQARLQAKLAALQEENANLRAKATELESDLNITRGAQSRLSKQALELQGENTQIKEDLAFLQKLVADTGKQGTFSIQRLTAERERDDAVRYSVLIVRGGNPTDEFAGQLMLQANLSAGGRSMSLTLPDDQPDTAAVLALRFKYYQRVDGVFRVPPGSQLKTLNARVVEVGHATPKVTRSLTFP